MEKLEIKSGKNIVTVSSNLSGTGSTESPIGYTGDVQHSDKRHLIWESTGNDYNTDITLSEPVTHFDKIMIYGSGLEYVDTMHLSKNVYKTQDKLMGCDAWGYSPWSTSFQANYILAANLKISGNSGHIGGSMYWGIGSKNATWAAGKWTGTEAPKMLMPWKIFGIDRKPTYNFFPLTSEGGTVSSNINPGYSGDIATITAIPKSDVWKMSALNITGAELTGNDFMFGNSNVSAQAEFEHSRDLTLINSEHGTLSADKMSGFSGDVVTVDATTDEGWYFTGLNITGATATGNQFMFVGENVTAEGLYTDAGYPITYLSDDHVHLTGDQIYIPGSEGITLDSGYDTYYRISGYDITGGSIVDGKLLPTGPCTIKAVEKVNAFSAAGKFSMNTQGNFIIEKNTTHHAYSYAYYTAGENVPDSFKNNTYNSTNNGTNYSRSDCWRPTGNISGYEFRGTANSTGFLEYTSYTVTKFSRLQVEGSNFGAGNWTNSKNAPVTATGVTNNTGYVRRDIYLANPSRREYVALIASVSTNQWTATGIAP
jgi:hypothetical protein